MYQEKKIKSRFRNYAFALLGTVLIATTSLFSGCGLPTRGNQILISPNALKKMNYETSVPTPTMQVVEFPNPRRENEYVYLGQNVDNPDEQVIVYGRWNPGQLNPEKGYLDERISISSTFQGYPADLNFHMPKYGKYEFQSGRALMPGENRRLYEETPGVLEIEKKLDGVIQGLERQTLPEFNKVEFIQVSRDNMILARLAANTKEGVKSTYANIGYDSKRGALGSVTTMTILEGTDLPPVRLSLSAKAFEKPMTGRDLDSLRRSVFNSGEWRDYYEFKMRNPDRDYRDGEKPVLGIFEVVPVERPTRGEYDNYIRHPSIVRREKALIETALSYASIVVGGVDASLRGTPQCTRLTTNFTSPKGTQRLLSSYGRGGAPAAPSGGGRARNQLKGPAPR